MPRTKAKRTLVKNVQEEDPKKRKEILELAKNKLFEIIENARHQLLEQNSSQHVNLKFKYRRYHDITLNEINQLSSFNCTQSTIVLPSHSHEGSNQKKITRSSSCNNDEGYLTTDSTSSGPRQSRGRVKKNQNSRLTRSLSRTVKNSKAPFKTPVNTVKAPNSYGVVTPKCKPNTPQVLLRRPNAGEVALSFQGSPLMTNFVVSDNMANVNIPCSTGTLSLQPLKGLRMSQIPNFDTDTLSQLQTLKENLEKIFEAQVSKK